jgi:hypothetical protein
MIDFVKILSDYCTQNGWLFSYGNASNRNLLSSDTAAGQIYVLLDPVRRSVSSSEYGGDGNYTFQGSFMMVVKSDRDQQYHNQKDQLSSTGKYEQNIKPLLDDADSFKKEVDCSNLDIGQWDIIDLVDVLDVNLDGILISYRVEQV